MEIKSLRDLNIAISATPDAIDIIEAQRVTQVLIAVAAEQPNEVVGVLVDELIKARDKNPPGNSPE